VAPPLHACRQRSSSPPTFAHTAHLADIQDGTLDLLAFVDRHAPELTIYDLPRPYERHGTFFAS